MADAPAPAPQAGPAPAKVFPYAPSYKLAGLLLAGGLLVIFGTAAATTIFHARLAYTGGDAAASAGILFMLALIIAAPNMILDDSPDQGGEPSTMRVLTLAIVFAFCALMLKTGWDTGKLPSLQDQGNWVWLITAALGGKALQKYAEIRDK
jgi:hypothetical protein